MLLTVLFLGSPVLAQGERLTMSVSSGFDGYCHREAWCPVRVVLSNEGPDIEGELHLFYAYTNAPDRPTVARTVSLPAHSRKAYFLYLPPAGWVTAWKARLVVNGEVLAEQEFSLRGMGVMDPLYVVVGKEGENLNFLADVGPSGATGRVAHVPLEALPPDPLGWEMMNVLVLADMDTSGLSSDQRRALEVWVAQGGHLVVAGGIGGERTAAGVADLLPVTVGPVRSVDTLWALEERLGASLAPGPYAVSEATVRDGEVLLEQDGLPLIVRRSYGAGVVDFLAFGTGTGLFARWEDAPRLWSFLFDVETPILRHLVFREGYPTMSALGTIPDLAAPSPFSLLAFMLAYILLIGPANYLVLRRLDRRELAWVTIPLLVVAFTGCAYLTGFQIRGNTPIVHRLVAVQVPPGSDVGRATAAVGLFSPRRATYDLQVEATGVRQAEWDFYYGPSPRASQPSRILQEAGGTRLLGVRVDVAGIQPFVAETYVDVPRLEADLRLVPKEIGFRLEGTVRNGPLRLEDAVLLAGYEEQRLGDLEPGAEVAVQIDLHATVRTTPGGPPVFVGPFGGGQLPERILGEQDFWNDPELFRRYQFLSALFPYNTVGLGPGAYLIGWADEGPPEAEVMDGSARQQATVAYFYNLPVSMPDSGLSLTVPPGLIICSPEETMADPFLSSGQRLTIRCVPWTEVSLTEVEEVEARFQGEGSIEVSAWDWDEETWVKVGGGRMDFTLELPASVVLPTGVIRLRAQADTPGVLIEDIRITIRGQR